MKIIKHQDFLKTLSPEAQARIAVRAEQMIREEEARQARRRASGATGGYTVSHRKNGVWAVMRQNALRATSLHKSRSEADRAIQLLSK